ncbi:hypothetical protein AMECASPLE_030834 [Ameca splendens]|uniref:Uncharacterized protein n=1 Tax=Ameca splendens TaxID=208324 RepID=A0ABV0ZS27_9TELE
MAVSRLRVVSEVQGDTVSDILWRDPNKQREIAAGRGESMSEHESMSKKKLEQDCIPSLYGMIGRYMTIFFCYFPTPPSSYYTTGTVMLALYKKPFCVMIIRMYNCAIALTVKQCVDIAAQMLHMQAFCIPPS